MPRGLNRGRKPDTDVLVDAGEHVIIRQYNGPIPPASELEGLKRIDLSFPERIMQIAEAHAKADVQTKSRDSFSALVTPIIAQVITFLLGLAGIGGCIYLSRAGYEAGGIAAMVGSFSPMIIAALSNLKKK